MLITLLPVVLGRRFRVFIPPEFELSDDALSFDTREMRKLFALGRERALSGEAWTTQRAPATEEELRRLLDPRRSVDPLEARPWLRGDVE